MKKILAVTALAAVLGITGFYTASGGCGPGGMGGPGGCGVGMQQSMSEMDEATKIKFKEFLKDTEETRRTLAVKRAEKMALMGTEKPDANKIGQLAGELFDLRNTLHSKAEAAGLEGIVGGGQGCGKSDKPGFHHGRKGMMKGPDKMGN